MDFDPRLNRREFLVAAGAAAAGLDAATSTPADTPPQPLIIDCHAHIYGEDETRYPPIAKPYRPPAGKGTVADLRRTMKAAGVRFATAIHTSTFYRWDNRFIADASRANRDLLVGVCTLNPDDPRSPEVLNRFVKDFNVRGLRSIPAQSGRLDDPGVDALWSAAERLGIVINVLINREQSGQLEALVGRHPGVRVVIDHCLNLQAGPEQEAVLAAMISLARISNVHAKLSFVATGSAEQFPFRDMHEPCRAIIKAFGAGRCVWGSDFPCALWCPKATYDQHLRVFTHEIGLDAESKRQVLGETANRLWFS